MCDVCVATEVLDAKTRGLRLKWSGVPAVYMRARGREAEGPATYQIRRTGEMWPSRWLPTRNLADVTGGYGFDTDLNSDDQKMREWALGKRSLPTLAELRRDRLRLHALRRAGKAPPFRRSNYTVER